MPAIAAPRRQISPNNVTRACQDCGARLLLVDAPASPIGTVARLYACESCRHVEHVTTYTGIMGWLMGELRAPS